MQAIKNTSVTAKISDNVKAGMSFRQAFDSVVGKNAYNKLASQINNALKVTR